MYLSALVFGLVSSFHCMGMCGPIAFMLPVDRKNKLKQILQILSYHIGRLTTYCTIGLLFGLLGKSFEIFGVQQELSIITGIFMILIILLPNLFNKIPFSKFITNFIFKIKSILGNELRKKRKETFFTIGLLNGFLPCGMVYMAILGALSTHEALKGSFYMFLFGLGTIPLMTTVVYLGNFTNKVLKKRIQQFIPVLIIVIGFLFIIRGMGLNIPFISPHASISKLNDTINGCK